ncbi:benenodin family lasso peptide [Sphingobium yanoikuyae]|uniref:Benenodin family lasso peptide n=1 Tax=Sphingobium yanoikuyae TaxID=13690 RepID=A0A9X7YFC9_SPHYA|nr:benenodin family lasso peptide [Sphingobium yanoikuyae]QNG48550.1 benenodin family lasso peptide [Sphingobium yanoikuyae]
MERNHDASSTEVIELGVASVETQGQGTVPADLPGGINMPGILDD